jgi:hypothetical protein
MQGICQINRTITHVITFRRHRIGEKNWSYRLVVNRSIHWPYTDTWQRPSPELIGGRPTFAD